MVDAHDSKSCGAIHESSILSLGTTLSVVQGALSIPPPKFHMFMYLALFVGTATISTLLFFSNSEILSVILWALLCGLFYVHLEPYFLKIKKVNIKIANLKKPIKIVFIADLQTRKCNGRQFLRRIIKKITALQPDLVLIGGDLISNEKKQSKYDVEALTELSALTKDFPVYAVLGNHEYGRDYDEKTDKPKKIFADRHAEVVEILEKIKITLLRNTLLNLKVRGQDLCLYGTDDLWAENASWENIRNVKKETPLLALAHNPDTISLIPDAFRKPDLGLSGHTHGGQMRLPFLGPIGNAKLKLGRKYYQGLFQFNDIPLFVTHGLGESMFAMRLFTPPEIVELTLLPE